MRIGELARRTGTSVRALRYYEERGLLRPERMSSGYRVYAESDVDGVERIRMLLAAGLGTELIAQIMSCVEGDTELLAGCRDRLLVERERMTGDIDRLTSSRSLLDVLLASAN